MTFPPTCPDATNRAYTELTATGLRYVNELRCPELGIIGYNISEVGFPSSPTWVGECPCYVKKQAQDLMNAAENVACGPCQSRSEPVNTSILVGTITAAALEDLEQRFIKKVRAGGAPIILPPEPKEPTARILEALSEITGQDVKASISVGLPALPDSVDVELKSFQLIRGGSEVTIASTRDSEWMLYYSHEAMHKPGSLRPPFEKQVQEARFKTPHDAAEYAIRWLDSMDAWYEAIEQAETSILDSLRV